MVGNPKHTNIDFIYWESWLQDDTGGGLFMLYPGVLPQFLRSQPNNFDDKRLHYGIPSYGYLNRTANLFGYFQISPMIQSNGQSHHMA